MKKMKQTWEKIEVPRLCPEIKKRNGTSSHKLTEVIDALDNHLEENDIQETSEPTTTDSDTK